MFDLTLPELFDESDTRTIGLGRDVTVAAAQLRDSLSGAYTFAPVHNASDDEIGWAEHKAARKYDVDPRLIARLAQRLWGRSLAAERDDRVSDDVWLQEHWPEHAAKFGAKADAFPPRSLQAIRGHVTRELLKELEPKVEDVKRRRRAMRKEKKR